MLGHFLRPSLLATLAHPHDKTTYAYLGNNAIVALLNNPSISTLAICTLDYPPQPHRHTQFHLYRGWNIQFIHMQKLHKVREICIIDVKVSDRPLTVAIEF